MVNNDFKIFKIAVILLLCCTIACQQNNNVALPNVNEVIKNIIEVENKTNFNGIDKIALLSNGSWKNLNARRITIDTISSLHFNKTAQPYVLSKTGVIARFVNDYWRLIPENGFRNLHFSKENFLFAINKLKQLSIYNGAKWTQIGSLEIADFVFDRKNNLFILDSDGTILRNEGNLSENKTKWIGLSDKGYKALAVDNYNVLHALDKNGQVCKYLNNNWEKLEGTGFEKMTISAQGIIYALHKNGTLAYHKSKNWQFYDEKDIVNFTISYVGFPLIVNINAELKNWTGKEWKKMKQNDVKYVAVSKDNQLFCIKK